MKTRTLLITAALTAAGFATSAMAQVYSVNAVGYVNVTLKKGYNLIANPLNNGGNTLNEILPATTPLPEDSFVVAWDSAAGSIGGPGTTAQFFPGGGWDPGTAVMAPGKAFFIYVASECTVTFVGEVPQGSLNNSVATGSRYSSLASQVPQSGKVTAELGLQAAQDDLLLVWDTTKNPPNWGTTYNYDTGAGGWNDGQNLVEPVIGVGQGFFLFRSATGPNAWTRTFNVNQ